MTLVQAWVDSVSLLKPKNLKLFLLVTVKSIFEAYKIVFVYWSWLIALLGGYFFIAPFLHHYMAIYGYVASFFLYQILLFVVCLSTRPSVMQKNCAYFRSYMKHFIYVVLVLCFIPVALVLFFIPVALILFFIPVALVLSLIPVVLMYCKLFVGDVLVFFSGYIFFLLFFLDSKSEFKLFFVSWWNGLKMVVYNLPLIIVIKLVFSIPMYLIFDYTSLNFATSLFIGAILMPIPVCTYTNIYIKKLHDQFDLYFKQPK